MAAPTSVRLIPTSPFKFRPRFKCRLHHKACSFQKSSRLLKISLCSWFLRETGACPFCNGDYFCSVLCWQPLKNLAWGWECLGPQDKPRSSWHKKLLLTTQVINVKKQHLHSECSLVYLTLFLVEGRRFAGNLWWRSKYQPSCSLCPSLCRTHAIPHPDCLQSAPDVFHSTLPEGAHPGEGRRMSLDAALQGCC